MLTNVKSKILAAFSFVIIFSLLSAVIPSVYSQEWESGDAGFDDFDSGSGSAGFDDFDSGDSGFDDFDSGSAGFDDFDSGSAGFDDFDSGSAGFSDDDTDESSYVPGGDSDFVPPLDTNDPDTTPPYDDPGTDVPDDGDEPGFDPEPQPPVPPVPPADRPARWYPLYNQKIPQGSPDNTIVYPGIVTRCFDPDGPFVMSVLSFFEFNLVFSGLDLVIQGLDQDYTGTNNIRLSCNGVQSSFYLTIYPVDEPSPSPSDSSYGIHISSIRILSRSNIVEPGEDIGIRVNIENNGNEKLENVKLTAVIQELGIRGVEGPFDLKPGKIATKTAYLQMPYDVASGWYDIRITLSDSNGKEKRVVYREILVG